MKNARVGKNTQVIKDKDYMHVYFNETHSDVEKLEIIIAVISLIADDDNATIDSHSKLYIEYEDDSSATL